MYPNILHVGCFSHTLDNAGGHFQTLDNAGGHFQTPTLEEFIKLWVSPFSCSPQVWLMSKELTGRAMASYSESRWWSRWEVCNQLLYQLGDLLPFLQSHADVSPTTTGKLLQLFSDSYKKACL